MFAGAFGPAGDPFGRSTTPVVAHFIGYDAKIFLDYNTKR